MALDIILPHIPVIAEVRVTVAEAGLLQLLLRTITFSLRAALHSFGIPNCCMCRGTAVATSFCAHIRIVVALLLAGIVLWAMAAKISTGALPCSRTVGRAISGSKI
jgi:hypothetical protein